MMENNEKKPNAEPEVAVVELNFNEVMTTSTACETDMFAETDFPECWMTP